EEVIQYIYEKYGRDRAGLTATVISYRRKSALREVGKTMGLSLDQVDALSKNVDSLSDPKIMKERLRDAGLDGKDRTVKLVLHLARELRGFPRHLSQHVGGFVITRGRLDELVPIENAAMDARTVIEWDKDDIDALGILKVDCLALGMLTAIRKCFDLIEKHHGKRYDLATVLATDQRDPDNKPAPVARGVYDMICDGDTVGTFQIESRAQMQMLPRLKPRCFYDLVIEVAIIRPGPIQGGMVHPYLRRRDGVEAVEYPHPCTEPVLRRTLGVPLFQEQAMQLAVVAAGYTPGEADQLRKAMAAWKRNGSLDKHREKLLTGMAAKGIAPEFTDKLYKQLLGFCDYGFPESHSASFALLVYVSCYLKRYYPAAYLAAMLNSQPLGFYSPASLVRDAKDHGVEVLPTDVNASHWDGTLGDVADGVAEDTPATWGHGGPTVRLGFRQIKGLDADTEAKIVAAREHGPFVSVDDFAQRTGIYGRQLSILADADAFQSLGISRRDALWQAKSATKMPPLFSGLIVRDNPITLPARGEMEQVTHDYRTIGMSLRAHPMALIREDLARMGISCNADLKTAPTGTMIEIAGIVLCRQRPATAKGVTFMTIEDETGVGNVIIWQNEFERHRKVVCGARLVRVYGEVQCDSSSGKVVNVVARKLAGLGLLPAAEHTVSRDYR
ncbi:MAG: error-prone DNA polymerase, partial [Planctomycetes bacterium]|nr:error-prone DNA polymerase [Planctomycetota bacterium]